jgi:hypothetical protein
VKRRSGDFQAEIYKKPLTFLWPKVTVGAIDIDAPDRSPKDKLVMQAANSGYVTRICKQIMKGRN